MPPPFAAWILAGGQSRRMGTDKALLRLHSDDQPLLLRTANALAGAAEKVSVVADPAKYSALPLTTIRDRRQGCGPLAGIETALLTTDSDWNVVVACDLPMVDPGMFVEMLRMPDLNFVEAVIPRHADGKLEPLCALYHRRALPKITAALDAGTRRVLTALGFLTLRYFPVQDATAFRNLNNPEDLEQYRNG